jgi:hypothetical protein
VKTGRQIRNRDVLKSITLWEVFVTLCFLEELLQRTLSCLLPYCFKVSLASIVKMEAALRLQVVTAQLVILFKITAAATQTQNVVLN